MAATPAARVSCRTCMPLVAGDQGWYVGLGIGAPFGLKTEYNTPWLVARTRTASISRPSTSIRRSPGAPMSGFRLVPASTADDGGDVQEAPPVPTVSRSINPVTGRPWDYPAGSVCSPRIAKLEMPTILWGWNIGALFTPAAKTKIGVSYRSAIKYEATGNVGTGPSAQVNSAGSSGSGGNRAARHLHLQRLAGHWRQLGTAG